MACINQHCIGSSTTTASIMYLSLFFCETLLESSGLTSAEVVLSNDFPEFSIGHMQPNFNALVEPLSFMRNSAIAEGTEYAPVVYGDHVINKVLHNFWVRQGFQELYVSRQASREVHRSESDDVSIAIME